MRRRSLPIRSWAMVLGEFEIVVDLDRQAFIIATGMAKRNIKAIMGSISHEQKNELRGILLQLSEACPFHVANPEDCPLFPLRRMEPTQRSQWLNALSESDLAYLATYHRVCLTIKVELGLAKLRTKHP